MSFDTKYRPTRFRDVIGQKATIELLQELLRRGEIFQKSYVFAGPSGTGKTTTARILARAMLCENLSEDAEPCDQCESCLGILESGDTPAFKEMDAANHTGADNIRRIIEGLEYYTLGGGDRQIYLIDECFTDDTDLITEDGLKSIREIVETRYSGQVLSYDPEEGIPVWKPVTDWFDVGEEETIRLYFDSGTELEVTLGQELYTLNRGWVEAKDLEPEDEICDTFLKEITFPEDEKGEINCACGCGGKLAPVDSRNRPRKFLSGHSGILSRDRPPQYDWEAKARRWNDCAPNCGCGCGQPLHRTADQMRGSYKDPIYLPGHNGRKASVSELTDFEKEIVYGTLLGDTSISRPFTTAHPRLEFNHGLPQLGYALHKTQALSRFEWNVYFSVSEGYKPGSLLVSGCCSTIPCFEEVWGITRSGGEDKVVIPAWLDRLTPRSLAYWYMDDGSLATSIHTGEVSSLTFHTEGFSREENHLLADYLGGLGFPTRVSRSKGYYYLYLPRESAADLETFVAPYVDESMGYKTLAGRK